MKIKNKILVFLLLLFFSNAFGQIEQFNYKREIIGIKDQWHKINLPNDIFSKINNDFSDIRIYGITKKYDTIEAPYLLKIEEEKVVDKVIVSKILNVVKNKNGYFYTIETPSNQDINQIELAFNQQNFDWKITLEASQNQEEWFTVLDDYRILSIKNNITNFQFTNLVFPNAHYRFYRLQIKTFEKPDLISAKVLKHEIVEGLYNNYRIKKFNFQHSNKSKETEINIQLESSVPVSSLKLAIKDNFDYFRPITIKYLVDSFKTDQGWKYNYQTLTNGTLNSFDKNEFKFSSTVLQKIKIIILNNDNQPLNIDTVEIKGYTHELVTRITNSANYFMTYGNEKAEKPQYDIDQFLEKIPKNIALLDLGNEQKIDKEIIPKTEPLFMNKIWLWTIIIVIILLLGWFSMSMLRKK